MNSTTASLLENPHPKCHIVYPYADEGQVGDAVTMFAAGGLREGESVVLITTEERRRIIEQRLGTEGYDIKRLERDGLLTVFNADSLLCEVFPQDRSSGAQFKAIVGGIIEKARENAPSGKVRIYGEMVNLLCGHNDIDSAAEMEDLWNETIETHSVPLLCAYSLETLRPHSPEGLPKKLLDCHSHALA